jgi:hypothetical protein
VRAAFLASAATVAAVCVALPASAVAQGPSARQIHRAASRAERSPSLWATINICSSRGPGKGGELGVRGQMPSLGFASTLRMTVQLRYWSAKHARFMAIPGASGVAKLSLGSATTGLHQYGVVFGFNHSAGLLDASVDFTWTRGGRELAKANRITAAGHHNADYGRPAHYSAANCRLR